MSKADKLRDCPAVGRKITGQECGSNRGTRYGCTPDCAYCPWTEENYDQLLEISRKFDGKLMDFYGKTVGAPTVMQRLRPQDVKSEIDEMELMQRCHLEFYQREVRPGQKLFDLRRVLDDLRCECSDVLEESGATFTVCDRGLAEMARQYQSFCGWLVPAPFFQRLYGVAFPLSLSPESPRATALRHIEKLGGPVEGNEDITEWLGENFSFFVESVSEESAKHFERIWRNLDAKQCVAIYRFDGTVDDLGLAGREDFDEMPPHDEEIAEHGPHRCFVWLRAGASRKWEMLLPEALQGRQTGPGTPMWGHLRVFPGRVEISAMSAMHFEPMKKMAQEFFGDRLEFEKEFVADLAKQVGTGDRTGHQATGPDPTEVAQSPEDAELMQSVMRTHYEKFLREPVPALDGLTPREAAARPGMRGRLVDLMKGHLQSVDDLGRRHGVTHNIGWVLEELGLDELVAAPRSVVPTAPLPRNWWRTFSVQEVEAAIEGLPEEDRTLRGRCPPGLSDYFEDAADRLALPDGEAALLLMAAKIAIGVLVPRGCAVPSVEYDDMTAESEALLLGLLEAGEKIEESIEELIESSAQPALLGVLLSFVSSAALGRDVALRPLGRVRPGAIALVAVEIEALIRCLQRQALL